MVVAGLLIALLIWGDDKGLRWAAVATVIVVAAVAFCVAFGDHSWRVVRTSWKRGAWSVFVVLLLAVALLASHVDDRGALVAMLAISVVLLLLLVLLLPTTPAGRYSVLIFASIALLSGLLQLYRVPDRVRLDLAEVTVKDATEPLTGWFISRNGGDVYLAVGDLGAPDRLLEGGLRLQMIPAARVEQLTIGNPQDEIETKAKTVAGAAAFPTTTTTTPATPPSPDAGTSPPEDGESGSKGDKGGTGAKGDIGDKGDTAAKGDTGDTGAKGDTGDKGDAGDKGDKGDKGDPGDPATAGRATVPLQLHLDPSRVAVRAGRALRIRYELTRPALVRISIWSGPRLVRQVVDSGSVAATASTFAPDSAGPTRSES